MRNKFFAFVKDDGYRVEVNSDHVHTVRISGQGDYISFVGSDLRVLAQFTGSEAARCWEEWTKWKEQ